MRRARVDNNHAEIVKALRQVGATVESLARIGDDVPDLLVGYRGKNYVIEVKRGKRKLSPGQKRWHEEWCGTSHIAYSITEALTIIGASNPATLLICT